MMEIDLPNKDKILREGFINCILKEYLESTSDLPISIFRNFKQYTGKTPSEYFLQQTIN